MFQIADDSITPFIRRNPIAINIEQWLRYSRHHAADLDPFSTISVNPNHVYDRNQKVIPKNQRHLSHVIDGDWDTHSQPFEERILYQSLENHFINGTPWPETRLYQQVLDGNLYWRGVESQSELEHRCRFVDDLYQQIKKHGYMSQDELNTVSLYPREVKIAIGRQGRMFYVNGKHRLAIAKLLSLSKIPVNVAIRHQRWQELRDYIVSENNSIICSEFPDQISSHPDISPLLHE